jgi:hypothetical protein
LKKWKKLISIMEKKKTTSLLVHAQTSCSCELDSKRNSFSILHKSQSTKYKKNVKTIKCADVLQYVHLRLSTLEWHHQIDSYTPCSKNYCCRKKVEISPIQKSKQVQIVTATQDICYTLLIVSRRVLHRVNLSKIQHQIAFTLTAAWWYTSAIKKPEPLQLFSCTSCESQIRIHHVCIQRSQ